jgi:hypothetical protein
MYTLLGELLLAQSASAHLMHHLPSQLASPEIILKVRVHPALGPATM